MKQITLILLLFCGLVGHGQIYQDFQVKTDWENTLDDYIVYSIMVSSDSGQLISDTPKAWIEVSRQYGMLDSVKLAVFPSAGVATRTSTIYRYATQLYDLSDSLFHATQSTESLQPFISGNIAPNERWGLKQATGGSRTMSHPSITFTGTLTIVQQTDATGKTIVTHTDLTANTRTGIIINGRLYAYIIRNQTLTASQKAAESAVLSELFPEIPSVTIGDQTWATSNCEMVATPQGNVIANVTDATEWSGATDLYNTTYAATSGTAAQKEYAALKAAGMWCYYNNDLTTGAVYGKLYNWYAAKLLDLDMATANFGWRVASGGDYVNLTSANALKKEGTDYWETGNGGTNSTGYTALGTGFRRDKTGDFDYIKDVTAFWTSDTSNIVKGMGLPIRLVKDDVAPVSTGTYPTIYYNSDDIVLNDNYQGLEWTQGGTTYTRLGTISEIAVGQSAGTENLPIQGAMKRCLLLDNGTVNYYIDPAEPINKVGVGYIKTGTTTSASTDKLVDTGGDFITNGVVAGMTVRNVSTGNIAVIYSVAATELTLSRDYFTSGVAYQIGSANYGGADGQVMVEIPKFYLWHDYLNDKIRWAISTKQSAGFELHPAFFKDGAEVNYRYYSAFEGSMYDASTGAMTAKASIHLNLYATGDKFCSVAGQWPKTGETWQEYDS